MLTSFEVRCPHEDCRHFGNIIPRKDAEQWHGQASTAHPTVTFRCPKCRREFRGQISGDDVKIAHEEMATQ
jgi:Zn finger protein HypA/HybF involved in hydrogenase expression